MSFNQGRGKRQSRLCYLFATAPWAIEFYRAAFGAETKSRVEDNAGAAVAEVSVGESAFWLADESPEHQNFSQQALAAGAKAVLAR